MGNGAKKELIREFKKGQVIFKEKTDGDEMFIIHSGKVQLSRNVVDKTVILDILEKNEFFGEMALLSGIKRTATATALKDTALIVIPKYALNKQLETIPSWFVKMLKTLVKRLEDADLRVGY